VELVACQPAPTTVALDVFVFVASSWNPRCPPALTYTYPIEFPAASRNRSTFTCETWDFSSKPTRANASAYVAASVFLANVLPFVVFASAANVPERTSVFSTVRPALDVHADVDPDSNPSANTGTGADGVVTGTAVVNAETFPEVSRARIAYWY